MADRKTLPVWHTVGETYRVAGRYWWRLAAMGLPFLAIAIFLSIPVEPKELVIGPIFLPEGEAPVARPMTWIFYMLLQLRWQAIFLALAAIGLVAIHRLVLLEDRGPFAALPIRLGGREVRFFFVLLVAVAPATIYSALFSMRMADSVLSVFNLAGTPEPGDTTGFGGAIVPILWLGALFCWWLTLRLSLGLPAAALDMRWSLDAGWRLGRSNNWRLLGVAFVVAIPLFFLLSGIEFLDFALMTWESKTTAGGDMVMCASRPTVWAYTMPVAQAITLWSTFVLEAIMLSLSYRALDGMAEPANKSDTGIV